jgi:hypothetical protein
MNGNGRMREKGPNMAASVSDLTHDVIELSELQIQLLKLDLQKSSQRTRTCLVLAVLGACLLLGAIPVALLALAELLVAQLAWSRAAGLCVATLVGLALAAVALIAAWVRIHNGLISLQRSRDELQRNIDWIKSTLRSRGQPHAPEKPLAL